MSLTETMVLRVLGILALLLLLFFFFTGLLKFCTLGFFFVFHLVDIVLIATQVKYY